MTSQEGCSVTEGHTQPVVKRFFILYNLLYNQNLLYSMLQRTGFFPYDWTCYTN